MRRMPRISKMKLSELTALFRETGIEEADTEARLLFSHIEKRPYAALFGCDPVSASPLLKEAADRRTGGEPPAYIIGEAPFFRQSYYVNRDCLIPRFDTERLVEEAIRRLPKGARFADLCTGSGAIAVSILCERKDTTAVGMDISGGALEVARRNAARYGVSDRLTLLESDLLKEKPTGRFDAILSNPPYIETAVLKTLPPDVQREPEIALDGGEDGLLFYRRFMDFLPLLKEKGFFLFECGYDQREALCRLAEASSLRFTPFYDYGKNYRGCILEKPE